MEALVQNGTQPPHSNDEDVMEPVLRDSKTFVAGPHLKCGRESLVFVSCEVDPQSNKKIYKKRNNFNTVQKLSCAS